MLRETPDTDVESTGTEARAIFTVPPVPGPLVRDLSVTSSNVLADVLAQRGEGRRRRLGSLSSFPPSCLGSSQYVVLARFLSVLGGSWNFSLVLVGSCWFVFLLCGLVVLLLHVFPRAGFWAFVVFFFLWFCFLSLLFFPCASLCGRIELFCFHVSRHMNVCCASLVAPSWSPCCGCVRADFCLRARLLSSRRVSI